MLFYKSFPQRLLFWYFLEHITLPVIRIYWGHNFSISRHTVKHVLSQVKKNNRKTRTFVEEKMSVLLNGNNQNFWAFESLVMEFFLSSSLSLGGAGTFEEVGALAQKKQQQLLKEEVGTKSNIG